MTQKEIASIQKTTVINVKLRIHRGKKKLAELLEANSDKVIELELPNESHNIKVTGYEKILR